MPPKEKALTHVDRKAQLLQTVRDVNIGRGDSTNEFALFDNLTNDNTRVLYVVLPPKFEEPISQGSRKVQSEHLPKGAPPVPKSSFISYEAYQAMLKAELDRRKAKENKRIRDGKREAETAGTDQTIRRMLSRQLPSAKAGDSVENVPEAASVFLPPIRHLPQQQLHNAYGGPSGSETSFANSIYSAAGANPVMGQLQAAPTGIIPPQYQEFLQQQQQQLMLQLQFLEGHAQAAPTKAATSSTGLQNATYPPLLRPNSAHIPPTLLQPIYINRQLQQQNMTSGVSGRQFQVLPANTRASINYDAIVQFINVTRENPDLAQSYLQVADGNVGTAVNLFFTNGGASLMREQPRRPSAPKLVDEEGYGEKLMEGDDDDDDGYYAPTTPTPHARNGGPSGGNPFNADPFWNYEAEGHFVRNLRAQAAETFSPMKKRKLSLGSSISSYGAGGAAAAVAAAKVAVQAAAAAIAASNGNAEEFKPKKREGERQVQAEGQYNEAMQFPTSATSSLPFPLMDQPYMQFPQTFTDPGATQYPTSGTSSFPFPLRDQPCIEFSPTFTSPVAQNGFLSRGGNANVDPSNLFADSDDFLKLLAASGDADMNSPFQTLSQNVQLSDRENTPHHRSDPYVNDTLDPRGVVVTVKEQRERFAQLHDVHLTKVVTNWKSVPHDVLDWSDVIDLERAGVAPGWRSRVYLFLFDDNADFISKEWEAIVSTVAEEPGKRCILPVWAGVVEAGQTRRIVDFLAILNLNESILVLHKMGGGLYALSELIELAQQLPDVVVKERFAAPGLGMRNGKRTTRAGSRDGDVPPTAGNENISPLLSPVVPGLRSAFESDGFIGGLGGRSVEEENGIGGGPAPDFATVNPAEMKEAFDLHEFIGDDVIYEGPPGVSTGILRDRRMEGMAGSMLDRTLGDYLASGDSGADGVGVSGIGVGNGDSDGEFDGFF
ncbi:hypothetical protein HK097_003479 [Rhizophlyctis rosea]|uniref:Uncharacterized protein n=1 Tax=Rhizophlyctis rosea TaxID=64517 RepID=A0AAD5SFX3_9FUNG|nr:hypothetical protein HK097_003479 [Rhizophlyctis rosea]